MTSSRQFLLFVIGCSGLVVSGCVHHDHPGPIADRIPTPPLIYRDPPPEPSKRNQPPNEPVTIAVQPSESAPSGDDARARVAALLAKIQDAYFDYDRHNLRPDAVQALQGDVALLKSILREFPSLAITIEGHCDERGSAEYNLGLGDVRAQEAKEFLAQLGIPDSQVRVISFGKERPQCPDADEVCWQKNRRAHLAPHEN
jgi:outer membrane protein OmpA-like peptidoglycan-associated protein